MSTNITSHAINEILEPDAIFESAPPMYQPPDADEERRYAFRCRPVHIPSAGGASGETSAVSTVVFGLAVEYRDEGSKNIQKMVWCKESVL